MCERSVTARPDHPSSRGARGSRGFTLLEALLAGVILAAVGVAVGGAVIGSLRAGGAGREYAIAAQLLDDTMTKLDLIGPSRIRSEGPTTGTFPPPHERFRWSVTITEPNLPDLFEVTLTVTWASDRGERSAVAATRLFDPINSRNPLLRWEDL